MLNMDYKASSGTLAGVAPGDDLFFKNLSGFSRFSELTTRTHYVAAPSDWYVVMTDVRGSTDAIAQGRYKEVNLVGAAAIMAILNIAPSISIPYAFGGDGATMLIPPSLLDKTLQSLGAVQAKVQAAFQLELRAGCVSIAALYEKGAELLVAKYHLSPQVSQAVFQGNALALAETWLKKGGGPVLRSEQATSEDPDLHGLECRWQPLENRNGKMLSLLVKAAPGHAGQAWQIYNDIIHEIETIYPEYAQSCPSHPGGLHISFAPSNLSKEVRLRGGRTLFTRVLYFIRILILNALGQFSFKTGIRVGGFDGTRYLSEMVANSDARKFDEMLRMVLDSSDTQHRALEKALARRHRKGEIVYGIHTSPQALMTCLVFSLAGNHVHLVDGADGGYAVAARQMKQQMQNAG